MADLISDLLKKQGPMRGSKLASTLQATGLSPEAARQRLSRARPPVHKFPLRLLPKNEAFYYLHNQRNTEIFWDNFLRDMREAGSVYALAIDGLSARGGVATVEQFAVVSGAPANPMKGQVNAARVLETLKKASFIDEFVDTKDRRLLTYKGEPRFEDSRSIAEMVVLDALREWARKLGFAGYNTIAIRGEPQLRPIGPFAFDLAGPSWFGPLQQGERPGFLVADVFAEGTMNEHHIQYFLRKVTMLRSMRNGIRVMPILVGESFTGPALTAAHAAGVSLATPTILFGRRVGAAIASLVQTLKNVAAYASAESSERITGLIADLSEIEGRAGNLRGVLFELMAGYLARRSARSIDMGVIARDPMTGKHVDIDVLKVEAMDAAVTCIECKGKEPGGVLSLDEVKEWLAKTTVMRAHLANHSAFREARHHFEIWTSGTIAPEALAYLQAEKVKRTKATIDWRDGADVLAIATIGKEKAMADALQQHFFKHPLAEVALEVSDLPAVFVPISTSGLLAQVGPAPYGGFMSLPDKTDQFS